MIRHNEHHLPLIKDNNSKILILGSFPSVKSMEKDFYYMHPQNRFYRLLDIILEDDFYASSPKRKEELLIKHHIALYDVIESCSIRGSSDASIKDVVPARIEEIIKNSSIKHIFINGKKAYSLFVKYNSNLLNMTTTLPSTSPANAKMKLDDLLKEWMIIKDYL